jgi:hypothetical protein
LVVFRREFLVCGCGPVDRVGVDILVSARSVE